MARWSKSLGNSVNFAAEKLSDKNFLEDFYEKRVFVPSNDQERKEYNDFCFVSSAMYLAIYVSLADGESSPQEKKRLVDEMIIQLGQRSYEYEELSENFGTSDREIIDTIFNKIEEEIKAGKFHLDEIVRVVNMIYGKNPFKRNYLLRLSYIVGYADKVLNEPTQKAIELIADKLKIEQSERDRIQSEVKVDYKVK
ncbi:MAG: TerB family tellurite resistance protein [Candidatus Cloacimonadia bacterium]|jgi:uncharacterized tellurite resistance protein B-like protein